MSLRRTAITRRTELRRGAPLARTRWATREHRTRPAKSRPKDTGPTAAQKRVVAQRANYCCEICGRSLYVQGDGWTAVHSYHHRQPRGMGGTSRVDVNSPANLLLLCGSGDTGCHGVVESDRTFAYDVTGHLVRWPINPATVPVLVALREKPVFLTDDGEYAERAA